MYLNFIVQLSQEDHQISEMLGTQECVGLIDKCRDLRKQHILIEIADVHAQKLAKSRKIVLTIVQNNGLKICLFLKANYFETNHFNKNFGCNAQIRFIQSIFACHPILDHTCPGIEIHRFIGNLFQSNLQLEQSLVKMYIFS